MEHIHGKGYTIVRWYGDILTRILFLDIEHEELKTRKQWWWLVRIEFANNDEMMVT